MMIDALGQFAAAPSFALPSLANSDDDVASKQNARTAMPPVIFFMLLPFLGCVDVFCRLETGNSKWFEPESKDSRLTLASGLAQPHEWNFVPSRR
jgi:hypothetical protein